MSVADCRSALDNARAWLSPQNREASADLVADYLDNFRGARFDQIAATTPADQITSDDLDAVRTLSIRFPNAFVRKLEDEQTRHHLAGKLAEIPSDIDLKDLSDLQFDRLLGPQSVAWELWTDLSRWLREGRARAPLVGASKLLAAKRLRLIPLEDSYVRSALCTERHDIWAVIHCLVRDREVGSGLRWIRDHTPSASTVTTHRIMDIIAWRIHQGHGSSLT